MTQVIIGVKLTKDEIMFKKIMGKVKQCFKRINDWLDRLFRISSKDCDCTHCSDMTEIKECNKKEEQE